MDITRLPVQERVLAVVDSGIAALCQEVAEQAGLVLETCTDIAQLCEAAGQGCGAVVLTEDALAGDGLDCLAQVLQQQPPWSDLPVILLTRREVESPIAIQAMQLPASLVMLEQPVRPSTFMSALRTALRARRRQYEIRNQLEALERTQASLRAGEETLRRRLEELDALLDMLPVGIFLAQDASCTEMSMNAAGAAMLGIEKQVNPSKTGPETNGLGFRVLQEGAEVPDGELPMQRAARTGQPEAGMEFEIVRADGTTAHLYEYASPLFDETGRVRGCLGVFVDLSERKRAEEAQARLAAIVESSEDAILSMTLDGIIVSWNVGAERLYGHSAREAIGSSITLIVPRERRTEEQALLERLRRGERIDTFETVRVSKQGRAIDVSLTISPVRDAQGRIIGASKVARDISARKQAEAALRHSEERLREADRRKDEFLATLAHELRNPLAPIRNALHILRLRGGEKQTEDQLLDMVERQVTHLVRLVDDLLEVSRITRGTIELRRQPLDLAAIVRSALDTSRPLIEAARHALHIEGFGQPLPLYADPVRLAQVVANVLNNAAKYTPPGGQIRIMAAQDADEAVLRVRDSGIGIAPDMLPKIFDMFTQAHHHPFGGSEAGLGIGLALARTLVTMHGGTIEAHSAGPGQGSEFVVRLPLAEHMQAQPDDPALGRTRSDTSQPRNILVVDDNVDSAQSLAMLLSQIGHRVRVAHTGQAAIESARAEAPEVVLLDIGLPEMNGYDVARRLRRQPATGRALLIALTGYGQEEDRRRSTEAGFDAHLVKPVDLNTLSALLSAPRRA
jgi:PAS domain S-box-containing protein